MDVLKTARWGTILLSALAIALGLTLLMNPAVSVAAACYLAGALLMAGGVVRLLGFFSGDVYRLAFQFDLALGLTSLLLGLIVLLHPLATATILLLVMGVLDLAEGLLRVQTAMDAKRFGLRYWWMMMAAAALSSLLGAMMVFNPLQTSAAMMAVFGAALLAEGVQGLCFILCAMRRQGKKRPA